ncbi:hypothetical protein M2459_001786 [Parabacteroides sp. PF5-5]|nr:hypothetical protein [Parabacteroides sp. PH5-39]MDH6315866.1 hypothetical protein [Parabacteroides sp. PF5-13]MDH6319523.1 hypothetical protein [Parabacteroides sp. PH5-13]MDH6323254.1 hypothetical protein [Parabacteroides sp. PH5-8]MDH6327238.1 hypothetical protein [Parabacteroides sp. PH5-41]MDH6335040.1 hypothetical protein [Parabacteroides sp. PF5-5]MDH6346104.1 hypothetical protein [Parabacteroides sp. PH5-46]MDH6360879.1 hypothetical protein [Parabacteroides sp. PH5-16]MDH6376546.
MNLHADMTDLEYLTDEAELLIFRQHLLQFFSSNIER